MSKNKANSEPSDCWRDMRRVGSVAISMEQHTVQLNYIKTPTGFTLGNIVFLLMYGFASCRPGDGPSARKLIVSSSYEGTEGFLTWVSFVS
ncbi:hypothetical protein FGIG_08371 [Fasciola gigantica]|uniref:Uncharacterized protein n=1 Tax=Fasciola gigantica TaxID=46835 RepID=A0A504YWB8_FASGI|nr:hypothetical protein FGIG_08371 [Fasciola gigantica]